MITQISTSRPSLALLLLLGALLAVTSLSTDTYLPAMPILGKELHGDAELTISGFLAGFAIAQLIWGPISDRIGRKIPLYIGMAIFIIGSMGCVYADSMAQFVFWRVIQAIGACTAPMLGRAMVRDLFHRTEAAQVLSALTLVIAMAPIFGPLLGGQILRFASWHAIFVMLAVIGALLWLALFVLPETHLPQRRNTTPWYYAFRDYCQLVRNYKFMRYTLCVSFYYVAAYAFITASPYLYIEHFHIAAVHFGWLFAINIIGIMLLSVVNRSLVTRFSFNSLLKVASGIGLTAMLLMGGLILIHVDSILGIVLPMFVFFSMNGIIAATATAAALDDVPHLAGSGAALIGSLQYGSGVISSILLAYFGTNLLTFAVIMVVFALLSFGCMFGKKW